MYSPFVVTYSIYFLIYLFIYFFKYVFKILYCNSTLQNILVWNIGGKKLRCVRESVSSVREGEKEKDREKCERVKQRDWEKTLT